MSQSTADIVSAIDARDLHFRYQKAESDALKGLSLQAHYGKITGLLGPNGSGKSTAFQIISTQRTPDSGESFVGGYSSTKDPRKVRRLLGVTFQTPSIDPLLTVRENLEIHAALLGLQGNYQKIIDEKLNFFGLLNQANHRSKTLSGGMQRRVELAKTLMGRGVLCVAEGQAVWAGRAPAKPLAEEIAAATAREEFDNFRITGADNADSDYAGQGHKHRQGWMGDKGFHCFFGTVTGGRQSVGSESHPGEDGN